MSSYVFDASALLAYLHEETGADEIEQRLDAGVAMSSVNMAEALSKSAERGGDPREVLHDLRRRGVLGQVLLVRMFDQHDALAVGELRPATRAHGLSLADRACVALAQRLGLPVVTTDRAIASAQLPVEVELIR